jgi:hypothetical protein
MTGTPSIRQLWTLYKALLLRDGTSRREVLIAQEAFYSGARGMLEVLHTLVQDGEVDELQRVIGRHHRTNRAIRGDAPRKRRH